MISPQNLAIAGSSCGAWCSWRRCACCRPCRRLCCRGWCP